MAANQHSAAPKSVSKAHARYSPAIAKRHAQLPPLLAAQNNPIGSSCAA
jgi:hypothetical protein